MTESDAAQVCYSNIATAVAVTAAICMVVGYRLSATNSLPPDASQPNQYSFLNYFWRGTMACIAWTLKSRRIGVVMRTR